MMLIRLALVLIMSAVVWADGPADNLADKVRQVPPTPRAMAAGNRADIEAGAKQLGDEIAKLRGEFKGDLAALLPDVEIYYNALRYPLIYDEPYDMKLLRKQITEGMDRAKMLREGKTP